MRGQALHTKGTELDTERHRLAAELHPDRGQDVPERVCRAWEEMLKHVNAAYERFRPFANGAPETSSEASAVRFPMWEQAWGRSVQIRIFRLCSRDRVRQT